MADDRRGRRLHALALGGFLFSLLYLPPPGPGALFLYAHPLPIRWVGGPAAFVLTCLLLLAILSGLVLLIFTYSRDLLGEDLYVPVRKVLDPTGLLPLDRWGSILALLALVVLPFFSFHYLPLGLALSMAFLALRKAPVPPRPMGEPPPPVQAAPVEGERLQRRTYAWEFDYDLGREEPVRKAQFLELPVDLDRYERLRGKNPSRERRPGPGDLAELVGNGVTPEVERVAEYIRSTTRNENLCSYLEVLNTLALVQSESSIPYKSDLETTGIAEYWRYPLETLVDQAGDCECKSILAAALFRVLGRAVLFLLYPPREDRPGHMALAVEGGDSFPPGLQFFAYRGKRYFYCELTAEGMRPGEIPAPLRELVPEVYAIPGSGN